MPFDRYTPSQIAAVKELLGLTKDGIPQTPPERCKLTFKQIADIAGVTQATVGAFAGVNGIKPPPPAAKPGAGRPKGVRDRKPRQPMQKRSPWREPAFALFNLGKTPAEVTAELGIQRQYTHRLHQEWRAAQAAENKKI